MNKNCFIWNGKTFIPRAFCKVHSMQHQVCFFLYRLSLQEHNFCTLIRKTLKSRSTFNTSLSSKFPECNSELAFHLLWHSSGLQESFVKEDDRWNKKDPFYNSFRHWQHFQETNRANALSGSTAHHWDMSHMDSVQLSFASFWLQHWLD